MTVNGNRVLTVDNLHTYFFTRKGVVRAVNGVSFSLDKGRTLCLVGESGCGKSVASLSIMRLIASPPGRIVAGSIAFVIFMFVLSRRILRESEKAEDAETTPEAMK